MQAIFDVEGFYSAVDAARAAKGMMWKDVADTTGVAASTLSRMKQGKRPDADSLATLAAWAGINPASYVSAKFAAKPAEPLAVISQQIRTDPNLSAESANALEAMVRAAYNSFARKSD